MTTLITLLNKLAWACGIIIILAFLLIALFGCKTKDVVTYTSDGWKLHSIVPIDTNGIDKTLQ